MRYHSQANEAFADNQAFDHECRRQARKLAKASRKARKAARGEIDAGKALRSHLAARLP